MVFDPAFLRRFFSFFKDFHHEQDRPFPLRRRCCRFRRFGAHADEADGSQFALKFDTNRTRAEVQAEAVVEAKTHNMEPAGSRVVTYKSTADRAAVRAQAAEAVRTGQIPSGEFSAM